jgi:hypothetical protein
MASQGGIVHEAPRRIRLAAHHHRRRPARAGLPADRRYLVSPGAAPAIAALQNLDGETEAVVIDIDGNLCHVCQEALSDSGWNMFRLGAGFRAIGAVDAASVWALGLTDTAFWQGSHGRWTRVAPALASGQVPMEVSAGADGTVWAIADTGAAYVKGDSITQAAPTLDLAVTPVAVSPGRPGSASGRRRASRSPPWPSRSTRRGSTTSSPPAPPARCGRSRRRRRAAAGPRGSAWGATWQPVGAPGNEMPCR